MITFAKNLFIITTFSLKLFGTTLHISSTEELSIYTKICRDNIVDIMQEQHIIDCKNSMVIDALDEISRNPIGEEMLSLLTTKILYARKFEESFPPIIFKDVSRKQCEDYFKVSKKGKVIINLSLMDYDDYGNHKNQKYKLVGLTEDMNFELKVFDLADTIFHELVHTIHFLENTDEMYDRSKTLDILTSCGFYSEFMKDLYCDDEEFRTISGIYMKDGELRRDLISEYGYHLYKKDQCLCRVFHIIYNEDIDKLISLSERNNFDYYVD